MQEIVLKLASKLASSGTKIVTIESCTGGWIGKTLTDSAGSSNWFAGGLITYTNESKNSLAFVDRSLIETHGAVSIPVAEAMALGGLNYFENCISVAVSGIAGPDGGSAEKPVGTVAIAVSNGTQGESKLFHFKGDREQVRLQTVTQALQLLLEFCD